MFIQFTTENYRSFKEPVTLSMLAGKSKSQNKLLDKNAIFPFSDKIQLLKCAVIYGSNASGKSNLLSALRFMRQLVLNSSKESQADEAINTFPFRLAVGLEEEPSRFEIIFGIEEVIYQYGFSTDRKRVHSESLTSRHKNKDTVLFDRTFTTISCNKNFPEGDLLTGKTRENALFLSVCANFDGRISKSILSWFRSIRIISGLSDGGLLDFTRECMEGDRHAKISALLKNFDLGVQSIQLGDSDPINDLPNDASEDIKTFVGLAKKLGFQDGKAQRRVNTVHTVFNADGSAQGEVLFDLAKEESQGSRKLVALSGPIIDTLENSRILFIDEFDARLHPILSKTIIEIFNSSVTNSRNAQLVVVTHDTNLLDKELLRRDQIWFAEKDKFGASHISSLIEYRVRNDASFEKDYILGKYGAIPMLGNIAGLLEPDPSPNKAEKKTKIKGP